MTTLFWSSSKDQAKRLGLTPETLRTAKERYNAQRKSAAKRDIDWGFTFETWVGWWKEQLGPDWLKLRGRQKGQFVMARKGDKGPYHPENVECKTCEENITEQGVNGTAGDPFKKANKGVKNGRATITEEKVLEIFKAKGTYHQIMERFDVKLDVVHRIKTGKGWSHVTGKVLVK